MICSVCSGRATEQECVDTTGQRCPASSLLGLFIWTSLEWVHTWHGAAAAGSLSLAAPYLIFFSVGKRRSSFESLGQIPVENAVKSGLKSEMLPMESYISEVKQTARTRLLRLQKAVNQALKVLLNVCVYLLAHCGTGCHTGYFWEFKRSCWKLHLSLATRAGFGCTLENTEWGAPSTQCVLVQFSTMLIIISSN